MLRTIRNSFKEFLQVPKDSQHDYDRLTTNIIVACWSHMERQQRKDFSFPPVKVNFLLGIRAKGKFLLLIPLPRSPMGRELSTVEPLNSLQRRWRVEGVPERAMRAHGRCSSGPPADWALFPAPSSNLTGPLRQERDKTSVCFIEPCMSNIQQDQRLVFYKHTFYIYYLYVLFDFYFS